MLSSSATTARPGDYHLERHPVLAPLGNDDVGPALRRLDELEMHRAHRLEILAQHVLDGAAALGHVAAEPPDQPDVGVGVDVDLEVEQVAQRRLDEDQDPSSKDDGLRLDAAGALGAPVATKS